MPDKAKTYRPSKAERERAERERALNSAIVRGDEEAIARERTKLGKV